MIQVKRLGHATFKTPDLERIVDYWTRIIGLTLVDKDKNRAFLATKYGEEAIAVEAGEGANLREGRVPGRARHRAGRRAEGRWPRKASKASCRSDISPGVSKAIVLRRSEGHHRRDLFRLPASPAATPSSRA